MLPLYVDANQGWTDLQQSLDMTHWLQEQGVVLIEQPMLKTDPDSNAWLTERSPIPIIGDEAVQRLPDVEKAKGVYHGINIKLMKSAGMYEAHQMILKAERTGFKNNDRLHERNQLRHPSRRCPCPAMRLGRPGRTVFNQ